MFTLPNPPGSQAEVHELADFAELVSWEQKKVSLRHILALLNRIDDNDSSSGCDDDDDENAELLDETMNEIDRRSKACGKGYPFNLELEGTLLHYRGDTSPSHRSIVYRYLLLSTRLNMMKARTHAKIDGTLLLEELSAHVLRNYLGVTKAKSLVFGTSKGGSFKDRVDRMCLELNEGAGFINRDSAKVTANDDKLDTVAWIPFSDQLAGQLIIFGQCKTGTNWKGLVTQLQPDVFMKKWMKDSILVNPIRALCVSEAANHSRWKGTCIAAGILLDRCRLVDCCDPMEAGLLTRIEKWTRTAKKTVILETTLKSRGSGGRNKDSRKRRKVRRTK